MARPDQALFERLTREEAQHLAAAGGKRPRSASASTRRARTEPGESLKRARPTELPWSLCRRPWA